LLIPEGICAATTTLCVDEERIKLAAAAWFLTTLPGICAAMVPSTTVLDPIINAAEELFLTP